MRNKSAGIVTLISIWIIRVFVFGFDIFTFPAYFLFQKPWKGYRAGRRTRAIQIERKEESITFKPQSKSCPSLDRFVASDIKTMDKCFEYAVNLHSHNQMVGTREILGEEDEKQLDGKIFKKWNMGQYKWKSYVEVHRMATHFGRGLRELGLNPRERICIFSDTREEWMISALGCFQQTFPIVTLYANLGDEAIIFGITQTEVSHVITSHDLLPKFKNVLKKAPSVKCIIFLEDQVNPTDCTGYKSGVAIKSFHEVVKIGSQSTVVNEPPCEDDPAIIMYTSGSTGVPKGVVLPHEALITTVRAFHLAIDEPKSDDIYLGYLPLAHIIELLAEITMFCQGIRVGYSSPNTMIDTSTKIKKGTKGDCSILKPTAMCSVPLVIERIYKGIKEKVSKQGPFMEMLLDYCYKYKSYYRKLGMHTPIMDVLIFKKMRAIVGGRVRFLLSGGAPLSPDMHDYVRCALSVPLVQGYGLTESCACGTIMDKDEISTGASGPPLQGVLIRLTNWEEGNYKITDELPRGEIEIGGGNIATEYFRLPEKTKEDFYKDESGRRWFRTGDIGEIQPDGTLKVIDRKKDLVKLSYGEYVSLGKVESELKTSPLIESICIYGNSMTSYCVALVVPNQVKIKDLADQFGLGYESFEQLCGDTRLTKAILKELREHGTNGGLKKFELPGALALVKEEWTPESGLVTSAFKLKRKPIQDFYQKDIDRMYGK